MKKYFMLPPLWHISTFIAAIALLIASIFFAHNAFIRSQNIKTMHGEWAAGHSLKVSDFCSDNTDAEEDFTKCYESVFTETAKIYATAAGRSQSPIPNN